MNFVAFAQPMHMTRAHTHDVTRQHFQASFIGSSFKIVCANRISLIKEIDTVQAGDIQKNSARHNCPNLFDTEFGCPSFIGRCVRKPVIQKSVVPDMSQ